MKGLHTLTEEFLKLLVDKNVEFEAHDSDDPNDSDIVWIIQDDDEISEGEYMSFELTNPEINIWHVSHNSADKFGGHPTHWSKSGTIEDLLKDSVDYFVERKSDLQER